MSEEAKPTLLTFKALVLWQPWASWLVEGLKTEETRFWPTRYRGTLLVCAGKHLEVEALALDPKGRPAEAYPRGQAIGTVLIVNCRPMRPEHAPGAMVAFDPERYAWQATAPRRFQMPFPVRGRQGLFDMTVTAAQLRAALGTPQEPPRG